MVIRTKSVEYMPLILSVASFANGTCWTIYSLLKFDINILVSTMYVCIYIYINTHMAVYTHTHHTPHIWQ